MRRFFSTESDRLKPFGKMVQIAPGVLCRTVGSKRSAKQNLNWLRTHSKNLIKVKNDDLTRF